MKMFEKMKQPRWRSLFLQTKFLNLLLGGIAARGPNRYHSLCVISHISDEFSRNFQPAPSQLHLAGMSKPQL